MRAVDRGGTLARPLLNAENAVVRHGSVPISSLGRGTLRGQAQAEDQEEADLWLKR